MTKQLNSTICTKTHNKYESQQEQQIMPNPYVELFLCFNRVHCNRCKKPIEDGNNFEHNAGVGSGANVFRKYYHEDCWNRQFQ